MKTNKPVCLWICLSVAGLVGSGCQSGASHKVIGNVQVTQAQLAGSLPKQAPARIYVADFELAVDDVEVDQGVRGLLPGRLRRGDRVVPQPLQLFGGRDPARRAREIVDDMSDALVKGLLKRGTPAQRLSKTTSVLPKDGWLVRGVFTEVGEGNRLKRAAIGFGRGATEMDVQVGVSNLAGQTPKAAFAIFGTIKDPGKIPGAVVTMNPYVAAAKFVLEKNATDRDITKTADQIVNEVLKIRDKIMQRPPN